MAQPLRGLKHDHAETLLGCVAFTERGAWQMKSLDSRRYALSACVAVAMLAGCGGSQPPIGAPGAMPQTSAVATHADRGTSWMLPEAKSGDLLYASAYNGTYILSYPGAKVLRSLDAPYTSICSNSDGQVYFLVRQKILVYKHGGSKPISTLNDSNYVSQNCAWDSSSGNLAVVNASPEGSGPGNVAIFTDSKGTPKFYTDPTFTRYMYCTYDDHGNLFIAGLSSDQYVLAELPQGSSSFIDLSVNATLSFPNQLQWDGQYLALAADGRKIYRLTVSGSAATVVGTTKLFGVTKETIFLIAATE
jgi:hypothetical protein